MSDEERRACVIQHRRDPARIRYAAPGSQLCRGCIDDVARQLETLAAFDEEADIFVAEQALARGASGGPVTGSKEQPLVINRRITQLKIDAADILVGWVDNVIRDQQLIARQVPVEPGNLKRFCQFLMLHHGWSVLQDWADDYAGEVLDLGRKAWALLNPSGRRRFTSTVMRCVEDIEGERCEGNMWALLTPDDPYAEAANEMICDLCGVAVAAADWLSYGRKIRARAEGTAA